MVSEEQFLQKHLKQFYLNRKVEGPPDIAAREFGIGSFGQKISKRHLSFNSLQEFNSFLREEAPFFVSYSIALYRFPGKRPMPAKEFLGGDLVYEFDADDLPTGCKQQHDSWKCPKCGKEGRGRQLMCDECGSATNVEEWFCPQCLAEAKRKVFNLLDFLQNDFGFSEGIAINFSGRAGYHVHVRSRAVRQLSPAARIELIDYLTANNLNLFSHFKKKETFFTCPVLKERSGWPQRILFELIELLEEGDAEKIAVMGNTTISKARKVIKQREIIIKSIRSRQIIPSLFGRVSSKEESQSDKFWLSFLNNIVAKLAPIDRQTSTDVSKIVRVPETLHGGTGLIASNVQLDNLKQFDPLKEAIAFGANQTVKVFIIKAPRFHLAGKSFGPFAHQEEELPLHAAVFLLGRNSATMAGD